MAEQEWITSNRRREKKRKVGCGDKTFNGEGGVKGERWRCVCV